jgi:cytochrome b subunit of formate dehydrogenase
MLYRRTKVAGGHAPGEETLVMATTVAVVATATRGSMEVTPRQAVAEPEVADATPGTEYIVRFDIHQRIQHILMFTSFLTLAFTGLPQKFYTLGISQGLIGALGGLEMTQQIHHIAAYVMIFDLLYHVIYMVHSLVVRKRLTALRMIPMPQDVLDAFQMFKYFIGFSDEKPRFGRFSYLEKFDYWAVGWGLVIIGGSGLVLLFPVIVSQIVPGSIVPIALAAHSDEALLAVAWIFIVHFFYAHFAPAIFPFNPSIFTGRVSKERYAEEHPLEYEKLYPRYAVTQVEPAGNGAVHATTLVANDSETRVASVPADDSMATTTVELAERTQDGDRPTQRPPESASDRDP